MGVGICTSYDEDLWKRLQWGFIRDHFSLGPHWVRGLPDDYENVKQYRLGTPPVQVTSAADLPDWPIVLLSPSNGKYTQATQNIVTFEHPLEAIYYFGSDTGSMRLEVDFPDRQPDHLVYIPANKYPMHAYIAGAIIFYDRMVKKCLMVK